MRNNRRWFLAGAILLILPLIFAAYSRADRAETRFQWDLVSVVVINGVLTVQPGGTDTSKAADNSVISLTGLGTFEPSEPNEVTGGGTWRITNATGQVLGMGTYRVTHLVRFDLAPGSIPPFINDAVGNRTDAHSGLAYLAIRYSDGSTGILVVSCHLPAGSPDNIIEGFTASKGFVYFFKVTSGNTVFHELREEENERD